MVSTSDRPAGRSSDSIRSDFGMSTSSSSMELTPIVSSIAARSSGEWTRYGKLVGSGLRHLFVVGFAQQVIGQVAGELDLEDPSIAVRIRVHELRLGGELVVDFDDASLDRCIEIAGRFDRLDHAESLLRRDLAS